MSELQHYHTQSAHEFEGYIHFWRVISYHMGQQDEYVRQTRVLCRLSATWIILFNFTDSIFSTETSTKWVKNAQRFFKFFTSQYWTTRRQPVVSYLPVWWKQQVTGFSSLIETALSNLFAENTNCCPDLLRVKNREYSYRLWYSRTTECWKHGGSHRFYDRC